MPTPPITIDLQEGDGAPFDTIFDGYDFAPAYAQSRIVRSDSDGQDGYDVLIVKETEFALGEIGLDVTMDGYEGPFDRDPPPNAYDVPRTTTISFRVRAPAGPTIPPVFEGLGGWTD